MVVLVQLHEVAGDDVRVTDDVDLLHAVLSAEAVHAPEQTVEHGGNLGRRHGAAHSCEADDVAKEDGNVLPPQLAAAPAPAPEEPRGDATGEICAHLRKSEPLQFRYSYPFSSKTARKTVALTIGVPRTPAGRPSSSAAVRKGTEPRASLWVSSRRTAVTQ